MPGYVAITSAPVVVRGTIVVSHEVLDGHRAYGPSGVIKAFDDRTGELKWAWDPSNPNTSKPLTGDQSYASGSPDVWTNFTGGDKLGMVYHLPVGNPSGDYYSSQRSPDEREYGTTLTALNVDTGLPIWKFQNVHNDVWDYDPGAQPSLISFPGVPRAQHRRSSSRQSRARLILDLPKPLDHAAAAACPVGLVSFHFPNACHPVGY